MRGTTTKPGFAMVLVMVLVAAGVVLGISYLTVASLHVQVSQNYQSLSRARYLAESGLEHAVYILRFSPEQLDGTVGTPLGPFFTDETSDGYTISGWEAPDEPGRYTLTSTATVGNVRRTSSMTVYRTASAMVNLDHGILVGSGFVETPSNLIVNGNVHVNGRLFNSAVVNSNASATQDLWDPWELIIGSAESGAEGVSLPSINVNQYLDYRLSETDCQAVEFTQKELKSNNPLANGGAVTPGNVGGVVHLNPTDGDNVKLKADLNFTGTLVIDGNLELDGHNITITAVDRFPAIIVTGTITVTDSARNVTIHGVVVVDQGIRPQGTAAASSTTINGALVSGQRGYDVGLGGAHVLNHRKDRAEIYDFSQDPASSLPQVTVLAWND